MTDPLRSLRSIERELAEAVRVRPDDAQEYYAACCLDRALEYARSALSSVAASGAGDAAPPEGPAVSDCAKRSPGLPSAWCCRPEGHGGRCEYVISTTVGPYRAPAPAAPTTTPTPGDTLWGRPSERVFGPGSPITPGGVAISGDRSPAAPASPTATPEE